MKKMLALLLVLVMVFAMSTVAFAADDVVGGNDGNYEGAVNVEVEPYVGDVFSVNIAWSSLTTFTYKFTEWDVKTHKYLGGWTTNPQSGDVAEELSTDIAVTNNSNVAITVGASFPDEENSVTNDGLVATITTGQFELDVGENNNLVVTVSGEPDTNNDNVDEYTIGTITVTIAKTGT